MLWQLKEHLNAGDYLIMNYYIVKNFIILCILLFILKDMSLVGTIIIKNIMT